MWKNTVGGVSFRHNETQLRAQQRAPHRFVVSLCIRRANHIWVFVMSRCVFRSEARVCSEKRLLHLAFSSSRSAFVGVEPSSLGKA